MSDQEEGPTEFVLPIICPNCKHEINLAMMFALMGPEKKDVPPAPEDEEEDDGDDENHDTPQENNA